jgi:hypothetical protein
MAWWLIGLCAAICSHAVGARRPSATSKSTIARPCDRIARRAARSSVTYSGGATLRRR